MKKFLKILSATITAVGIVSVVLNITDRVKNKVEGHKQGIYEKYIKRPMDFFCALGALVVLSPVMIVTAVLVKFKLGSPVLFTQDRPGLNEKIFKLYKFRTMTDERDENGELLPDEVRLTKFGKMLRSTSLDELPELINILKGDMSVVGPRPQLVRDMVFMTPEQRKRHEVRQGLTGLAQVSGRNNISWEDKFKYDLKYVENINFIDDWKIILKTVSKVFRSEDIVREGTVSDIDFGDYLLDKKKINQDEYIEKQNKARELLEEI